MSTASTKLLVECATPTEALLQLCKYFNNIDESMIDCHEVEPAEIPQPARQLLVHQEHMTKTLAAFYGMPVDLHVLGKRHEGDLYSRKIMLNLQETSRVVEYGIVRIDTRYLPEKVKETIFAAHAPLGSILINHNVLRKIRPKWFLQFPLQSKLMHWFGCEMAGPLYGRMGTIYCDDEPAIELLEIVTAIPKLGP